MGSDSFHLFGLFGLDKVAMMIDWIKVIGRVVLHLKVTNWLITCRWAREEDGNPIKNDVDESEQNHFINHNRE